MPLTFQSLFELVCCLFKSRNILDSCLRRISIKSCPSDLYEYKLCVNIVLFLFFFSTCGYTQFLPFSNTVLRLRNCAIFKNVISQHVLALLFSVEIARLRYGYRLPLICVLSRYRLAFQVYYQLLLTLQIFIQLQCDILGLHFTNNLLVYANAGRIFLAHQRLNMCVARA